MPQYKGPTQAELAKVVLESYEFHEGTFNTEAYRCERESQKRQWDKRTHREYEYFIGPNASRYYHYSIEQCFQRMCLKHYIDI